MSKLSDTMFPMVAPLIVVAIFLLISGIPLEVAVLAWLAYQVFKAWNPESKSTSTPSETPTQPK